MKRTAEMIIVFLGFIIYGFVGIIGGFTIWMYYNQDQVAEMVEEVEVEVEMDEAVSKGEFLQLINDIGTSGWYIVVGAALALIVGGIAIYLLRGNRNARVAGITLIVSAIVITLITFGLSFLGGIAYVIAGIMCLARKPKEA